MVNLDARDRKFYRDLLDGLDRWEALNENDKAASIAELRHNSAFIALLATEKFQVMASYRTDRTPEEIKELALRARILDDITGTMLSENKTAYKPPAGPDGKPENYTL